MAGYLINIYALGHLKAFDIKIHINWFASYLDRIFVETGTVSMHLHQACCRLCGKLFWFRLRISILQRNIFQHSFHNFSFTEIIYSMEQWFAHNIKNEMQRPRPANEMNVWTRIKLKTSPLYQGQGRYTIRQILNYINSEAAGVTTSAICLQALFPG